MFVFLALWRNERVELVVVLLKGRFDFGLIPIRFSFPTKRPGPLSLVPGIEGAGDPVPVSAAAFDSDLLLDIAIHTWRVHAHPRTVE